MPNRKNTPLPASLSGEIVERLIRVDKSLLYLISGALEYVADREPYDETGALTVDQVRTALGEMIWTYYQEKVNKRVIGEIAFFGFSTPPEGWLECDGSEALVEDYPALYDAIGDNFGMPSTSDYFVLPDLRYRPPVGRGVLSSGGYEVELGQKYGQPAVSILTDNLPPHNHQVRNRNQVPAFFHTGTAGANPSIADVAGTTNSSTANTTTNTGGGQPLVVLQPTLCLLGCIYAGE